jgi:hypothetical protein
MGLCFFGRIRSNRKEGVTRITESKHGRGARSCGCVLAGHDHATSCGLRSPRRAGGARASPRRSRASPRPAGSRSRVAASAASPKPHRSLSHGARPAAAQGRAQATAHPPGAASGVWSVESGDERDRTPQAGPREIFHSQLAVKLAAGRAEPRPLYGWEIVGARSVNAHGKGAKPWM